MATATAPSGFGRPIWNAIKGGNQVHGVGLMAVPVCFQHQHFAGSVDAQTDLRTNIFTAPASVSDGGMYKVEAIQIVMDSGMAADTDSYWSFEAQVGTLNAGGTAVAWTDLGSLALSSQGTAPGDNLSADLPYSLDIDGPEAASPLLTYLAPGDSVAILISKTGDQANGLPDLRTVKFTATLYLRHAPPGR